MATAWTVGLIEDTTANDSDKIFTVPDSNEWDILSIWVEYASTSTSGSRQLEIQFQSSASNVILQFQPAITQNESLTYNYLLAVGIPDLDNVRDDVYMMTPLMANAFLSAGQKIRVWDNNGIDPSADDMTIRIVYGYHEI